jgi:D-sedoheptulose 7-phosphate isomerase
MVVMKALIVSNLVQSIRAKEAFAQSSIDQIIELTEWTQNTLESGGKLLIFGNGGSAADAQHLAAEFVNRFLINRRPLPALALTTDTSVITSIGNDFSFDLIFSKQVEAFGKPEDLALGISTSGTSTNVVKAMEAARDIGMKTVALTGGTKKPGGDLAEICDMVLNVPTDSTPHIQEAHLWAEHMLCEIVEQKMFADE